MMKSKYLSQIVAISLLALPSLVLAQSQGGAQQRVTLQPNICDNDIGPRLESCGMQDHDCIVRILREYSVHRNARNCLRYVLSAVTENAYQAGLQAASAQPAVAHQETQPQSVVQSQAPVNVMVGNSGYAMAPGMSPNSVMVGNSISAGGVTQSNVQVYTPQTFVYAYANESCVGFPLVTVQSGVQAGGPDYSILSYCVVTVSPNQQVPLGCPRSRCISWGLAPRPLSDIISSIPGLGRATQ